MAIQKPFRDEIDCNDALRSSKALFLQTVIRCAVEHRLEFPVDGRTDLSDEESSQLRLPGVEQMAEFLFLMEACGYSTDPVQLKAHLARHNRDIAEATAMLKKLKQSHTDSGLSASRLIKGLLSKDQIDMLVEETAENGLRFDQSSLACLLIEAMSPEACRTLILLLSRTGFFKRRGTGSKFVRSTGRLEEAYRLHLQKLRDDIRNALDYKL